MVDQLAEEYAAQPVIFLEHYVYDAPAQRINRFWGAHGSNSASFPMIIVDSGQQVDDGPPPGFDFAGTYRSMVNAELARPPQAELTATYQRVADHFVFSVHVQNLSGVTLSSANRAAVHALIYEDALVGVTSRYVRTAAYLAIDSPLANEAEANYTLTTDDLVGVNWEKLHGVVMVDYRPASDGPYDMLQAALATDAAPPSMDVNRDAIYFLIDQANPQDGEAVLTITSTVSDLTWTITEDIPWLLVNPTSGTAGASAQVLAVASQITPGKHTGTITVQGNSSAGTFEKQVQVTAYLGPLYQVQLPLILK